MGVTARVLHSIPLVKPTTGTVELFHIANIFVGYGVHVQVVVYM